MINELLKLNHIPISRKVNYIKIPVTAFPINEEGAHRFNEIYGYIKSLKLNNIVRTKSGGISIAKGNLKLPAWDLRNTTSCIEMTLLLAEGQWRIQFRSVDKEKGSSIWGSTAFKVFKKTCAKYKINLDDYAISNGEEVKKEIESPRIELVGEANRIYRSVHHIDLNSSHISGMVKYHPYLREPFEEIYNKRKEKGKKEEYKAVLTHTWGFLQSTKMCGAKWAHISRDGIKYTNDKLDELTEKLVAAGRKILMYNTDGIWYQGEIYHDDTEGKALGQWKNDHTNCKFRAASKGKYEFIEDDEYHVVVRGETKLDKIKPRSDWEWGDIYNFNCTVIQFYWTENGIINDEGDLM